MRRFHQIDVFTDTLTQGNPVAVVHDATGLSDEQMAAFARWTNLSETTFLLPPTDPAADYRLRIWMPVGELPFAGHPTLGSARAWLEAGGRPSSDDAIVQQCEIGLVRLRRDGARLAFAAPRFLRYGPVDPDELATVVAALGLAREDVLAAQWIDNGPGWLGLLLRDVVTLLAVEPDYAGLAGQMVGLAALHEPGGPADLEVRALTSFNTEDPITGSLNAGLAVWLIGEGRLPPSYLAAQGQRRHRAGRIHVTSEAGEVWIGGDTVIGVRGEVDL